MTKKRLHDKIPAPLFDLAERIKREDDLKFRINGYEKIAEEADIFRKIKSFIKRSDKRGNVIDLITFIFIFLGAAIFFTVVLTGIDKLNDTIQASDESAQIKQHMQDENDGAFSWIDFGLATLFFLVLLVMIIINFFVGSNIILIGLYFFSLIFMGLMFTAGHNALDALRTAMPDVFAGLPLTSFILDSFVIIMFIFYILFFILFFAKPKGEGVGQL